MTLLKVKARLRVIDLARERGADLGLEGGRSEDDLDFTRRSALEGGRGDVLVRNRLAGPEVAQGRFVKNQVVVPLTLRQVPYDLRRQPQVGQFEVQRRVAGVEVEVKLEAEVGRVHDPDRADGRDLSRNHGRGRGPSLDLGLERNPEPEQGQLNERVALVRVLIRNMTPKAMRVSRAMNQTATVSRQIHKLDFTHTRIK